MPTNPMLSAEHMGIVDAHKYGTTRDYATVAAALAAIGGSQRILLLPFSGDGVWTINSAVTIPPNVCLLLAPGVTWAGTGALHFVGQLMTYQTDWYQGSGFVSGSYRQLTFGSLRAESVGIGTYTPAAALHIRGTSGPTGIRIEESIPNAQAVVNFVSNNTLRAQFGLIGNQHMALLLVAGSHFVMTGGNLGIGLIPSVQLELGGSVAQKATGTAWSNPSDARIKTVQRSYDDGLAVVQALEPLWLKYNGLAGTNTALPEFVAVLAQDVQEVAPYMIGSYPAKLHPEDEEDTAILNFDGSTLLWTLVNAVKELATRVEALEGA
jgi:hypothetical protein